MITPDIVNDQFVKTKIIATVGPASQDITVLTRLIHSGVNIIRLNFSHGTHQYHQQVINTVREINHAKKTPHVCLLQDLQGPKIRIGELASPIRLETGQELVITPHTMIGTAHKVSSTYAYLTRDIAIGKKLLIDDGKITIEAVRKEGDELVTKVVHGGILHPNKGINLPTTSLSSLSLTQKDKKDLDFGLKNDVEWVALSFVRAAQDIIDLKQYIQQSGKVTKVIAKIEKPEALENIDAIIAATDAIMVARGDLGIEIAMERVPMVQKDIVEKCNQAGKPVIIATQIMESMIVNPLPTRAEVNDIANAVIDGADALMLSGETAVGKYPYEVITRMKKSILSVENTAKIYGKYPKIFSDSPIFYHESIVQAACRLSKEINAKAIVCMTKSGWAAFEVAKHRPEANIFVVVDNSHLLNTINLIWGVRGIHYSGMKSTDDTFLDIMQILVKEKHLKKGDVFISTASMPIKEKHRTNMLKINVVP